MFNIGYIQSFDTMLFTYTTTLDLNFLSFWMYLLQACNCNVSDCKKKLQVIWSSRSKLKCKGRPPCASRVQEWPPGFSSHKGIDLNIGVTAKSPWVPLTKLSGSRTMPACRKSRQPTVVWHWNGVWFPSSSLSTSLFFVPQSILHALSSMNAAPQNARLPMLKVGPMLFYMSFQVQYNFLQCCSTIQVMTLVASIQLIL